MNETHTVSVNKVVTQITLYCLFFPLGIELAAIFSLPVSCLP